MNEGFDELGDLVLLVSGELAGFFKDLSQSASGTASAIGSKIICKQDFNTHAQYLSQP